MHWALSRLSLSSCKWILRWGYHEHQINTGCKEHCRKHRMRAESLIGWWSFSACWISTQAINRWLREDAEWVQSLQKTSLGNWSDAIKAHEASRVHFTLPLCIYMQQWHPSWALNTACRQIWPFWEALYNITAPNWDDTAKLLINDYCS